MKEIGDKILYIKKARAKYEIRIILEKQKKRNMVEIMKKKLNNYITQ